ncbi:MAG: hypothetical protein LBM78_00905, partial [Clostridiales bacterium]|nr:hypothetical protein [Clostridiales bacterium]
YRTFTGAVQEALGMSSPTLYDAHEKNTGTQTDLAALFLYGDSGYHVSVFDYDALTSIRMYTLFCTDGGNYSGEGRTGREKQLGTRIDVWDYADGAAAEGVIAVTQRAMNNAVFYPFIVGITLLAMLVLFFVLRRKKKPAVFYSNPQSAAGVFGGKYR